MKSIVKLIAIVYVMMLTACRDDYQCTLTTTINKDGSITREYTMNVDSAFLTGGMNVTPDSMLQFDNSWELSWNVKGDSCRRKMPLNNASYAGMKAKFGKRLCDTINVNATRNFASAEEVEQGTCFKVGRFEIKPTISLEKSVRFFHTSYHYYESYPELKLNLPVPLDRYLSKEEAGYWLAGEPDLVKGLSGIEADDIVQHLKSQFTKWIAANIFELHFQAILDNYDKTGNCIMTRQEFAAAHDTLMTQFEKEAFAHDLNVDFASWMANELNTKAYESILHNAEIMAKVEAPLNDMMSLMMFKVDYKIKMPGGFVASRQLTGTRLIAGGFTIDPYVSVPNIWAYILSLAVLLASIIGLVYFRRQRHTKL